MSAVVAIGEKLFAFSCEYSSNSRYAQTHAMAETHKQRRARIKSELIQRRGGRCKACGYNKSFSGLCFHHRDPQKKSFNISGVRLTRMPRNILNAEADKCDVYCIRCHSELHDVEGWVHENGKRTPK